jgi:hypothetical protein
MGHIENDASNNSSILAYVFFTAVTFLPSRCLGTIEWVFTEPLPRNDRGIFPEPLPSNERGIHIHTQTDGRDVLIRPLR